MMSQFLNSLKPTWLADLRRGIRNHHWEETEDGLLISGVGIRGDLLVEANDGLGVRAERNLLTTQGKAHILNVIIGADAKIENWYVAPAGGLASGNGNVTYSANWTGATFNANASALTTQISNAERIAYVEAATSTGTITNAASPAVVTAAVTGVYIWGAGLLSNPSKTDASGSTILLAASKYTTSRFLAEAGDTLSITWAITLT
jgi:hypothetical protein